MPCLARDEELGPLSVGGGALLYLKCTYCYLSMSHLSCGAYERESEVFYESPQRRVIPKHSELKRTSQLTAVGSKPTSDRACNLDRAER